MTNETQAPQDIQELEKMLEKNFRKHFPKGAFEFRYSNTFSRDVVTVLFGINGKDKTKVSNYDKMIHSFNLFRIDADFWQFKTTVSKVYMKPLKGVNLVMQSTQTKMGNNKKISLNKIELKMQKFFTKLSVIMQDLKDADRISEQDTLTEYLEIN